MEQQEQKKNRKKYKNPPKVFGKLKNEVFAGAPSGKYQIDSNLPVPSSKRTMSAGNLDLLLHVKEMEVGQSMGFSADRVGKKELVRACGYAFDLGYKVARRIRKNELGDVVEYRFWVISKS